MTEISATSREAGTVIQGIGSWRIHDALRSVAFVAAFLLAWISLKPFADLGQLDLRDLTTGNETLTYAAFGCMAMLTVGIAVAYNLQAVRSLATPSFVLLAAWIVISVALSLDFNTSIRRFVLSSSVIAVALSLFLLPKSETELVRGLAISSLILLVVCYLGVLLIPNLSIHLATDVQEPHLAGDWRGVFGHKNYAAALMAMLLFIGIYVVRSGLLLSGLTIVVLAAFFLICSGGKSALSLWIFVLVLSGAVSVVRSPWIRSTICLLPLAILNSLSLGSAASDSMAQIVRLLPIDATFTGRTDIWVFALSALQKRLLTGYGFSAFWGSKSITDLPEGMEWAETASHSHNGYLDTALAMGLLGVILLIAVLVVAPIMNVNKARQTGHDGPLLTMCTQIWLFGIYLASMESFFLDRADPTWFTFLVAVFGLHYLARLPIKG